MKLKATVTFIHILEVPEILAQKVSDKVPEVVDEICKKFAEDMILKHGKKVEVKMEVVD